MSPDKLARIRDIKIEMYEQQMTRFKSTYREPSYLQPFKAEKLQDYKSMAKDILAGRTTKQEKNEEIQLQQLVSRLTFGNCQTTKNSKNCKLPKKLANE